MVQDTVVDIAGVKLPLAADTNARIRQAMESGTYEAPEIRALAAALRPDDVVMELGTGIGLLSAYCAKRIGDSRVFTFEANPELERHIRSTYLLNGVAPCLEICMLTDRDGEQEFYVHEAFWESSATADARARRVRVRTKPLNQEIRRINPTVLVMDIEGGECELMEFIDFHNVSRVIIEIHERKLGWAKASSVVRKLYSAGFRIDRNLSEWEICCLERISADTEGRYVSWSEFTEGKWRLSNHWAGKCFEALTALLLTGSRYALIDEDQWGSLQIVPGRLRVPFTENQGGEYWGPPPDDAKAIQELERMRDQGLQFIIFGSSGFWWLDHYKRFAEYLRCSHQLVLQDEHLIAFRLR